MSPLLSRFGVVLLALLCLVCPTRRANAHTDQEWPASLEMVPRRSFLAVRIIGNGNDLRDTLVTNAHASNAALGLVTPTGALTPATAAQITRYLEGHLLFKQGGRKLPLNLESGRIWNPDGGPDHLLFSLQLRVSRDPALATAPLRVTSDLFNYLGRSKTVVILGGEQQTLNAGATREFTAQNTDETALGNAQSFALSGASSILGGVMYLLFLVTLLIAAMAWPVSRVALLMGGWLLAYGVGFALDALRVVVPSASLVGVGIALSITYVGGEALWATYQGGTNAKSLPRLCAFVALCGLVHGAAAAPAALLWGLPEAGLPLSLFAFVLGSALVSAVLCALALPLLRRTRAHLEHSAQYGGLSWHRIMMPASCAVMLLGGYWMVARPGG